MQFTGTAYLYQTAYNGIRPIGVTQGLGAEFIVAWFTDNGSRRRIKSRHLPPMADRAELQRKLDLWAAEHKLYLYPKMKTYLCTVCHQEPVNVEDGFDTCPACAAKI